MMMTPVVEGGVFRYLLDHDLELMGPWSSNYTVASLVAAPDPSEREAAVQAYFRPLASMLKRDRPDLVAFSPVDYPRGASMHSVFVDQYHLFPTPGYEFWKQTRMGWILYRAVSNPN
jgi:hypothetical protein